MANNCAGKLECIVYSRQGTLLTVYRSGMAQFTKFPAGRLLQSRFFAGVGLRGRCSAEQRHLQPRLLWASTVHGVLFATKQHMAHDDSLFGCYYTSSVMIKFEILVGIAKGVQLMLDS